MMRKLMLTSLLVACLLSACTGTTPTSVTNTPAADAVATQVSLMLTNQPTATEPVPTEPAVLATIAPTSTTAPSDTPVPDTAVPTATTEATQTNTPLPPTETLTPTPNVEDPRETLGQPSWSSSLDGQSVFGIYDNGNTRVTQSDGALNLTAVNPNGWLGWSLTFSRQPQDFYLEGTFKTGACGGGDQYGLVFRSPSAEAAGYLFGVTCDGRYFLRAADFSNNIDTYVVQSTASSHILAGADQTNRLGVMFKGDQIALYANGKLIDETTDSTLKNKGFFGAFVASYQTREFTVKLDEIRLWMFQ